ncbi:MAG: peptidase T [Paramuribaculum sp.]|nr:peptidase T [Paramuribaculum sp.]
MHSEDVVDRFLQYVKFDTQSDELTNLTPSTPGQMVFAQHLRDELEAIGLSDISLDDNGYLMATLPASPGAPADAPTVGFIAHLDTSPDMSGRHVSPRIVENYDGGDITLGDPANGISLRPSEFPELLHYVGKRLIVTDGTTLLGADDKAGIAEIISAVVYLKNHPEIVHGPIRIAFNPDEEIGQGAHKFDVERFGADWAYTMDGGEIGELEYENFNAAVAKVTFKGRNVHPGYAKHKMVNSIRIANQFIIMLPRWETPEHTEGYEGFYHLTSIEGTVEQTVLTYIIRDHDRDRFERRKKELEHLTRKINNEFPGVASIDIKDQYYNMREKIEPVMHIIDIAVEAMKLADVEPKVVPIRGGTDGAQLSFKGLPCPNIFAGGLNFHGRYEFVPVESMKKAVAVIVEIARLAALKTK